MSRNLARQPRRSNQRLRRLNLSVLEAGQLIISVSLGLMAMAILLAGGGILLRAVELVWDMFISRSW